MGVRKGYWRSNELSLDDVRECYPRASCVGAPTTRPTLSEELCRPGHFGPICSACLDGFYKDIFHLCEECAGSGVQLFLRMLPVLVILGPLLLLLILSIGKCFRRDPLHLHEKLDCAKRCGRGVLYRLFGPISMRAVSLVLFAKVKIVISMLQIQLNMIPTFDIHFPEHLMAFLSIFSAINILDIPLDCFGKFGYRNKMLFYTGFPTCAFVVLWFSARWYPRQRELIQEIRFSA